MPTEPVCQACATLIISIASAFARGTGVYNTLGAPQFMQFLGDEGRHLVLRIRFFGKGK
jgi:hypothetical protein